MMLLLFGWSLEPASAASRMSGAGGSRLSTLTAGGSQVTGFAAAGSGSSGSARPSLTYTGPLNGPPTFEPAGGELCPCVNAMEHLSKTAPWLLRVGVPEGFCESWSDNIGQCLGTSYGSSRCDAWDSASFGDGTRAEHSIFIVTGVIQFTICRPPRTVKYTV